MNVEVVTAIRKACAMILSVIVTTVVIPYIKNKIGEEKYTELTRCVEYSVRCAEQLYTPEEWEAKKDYVMRYITEKAAEMNMDLSIEDINVLIEGIVNAVKH